MTLTIRRSSQKYPVISCVLSPDRWQVPTTWLCKDIYVPIMRERHVCTHVFITWGWSLTLTLHILITICRTVIQVFTLKCNEFISWCNILVPIKLSDLTWWGALSVWVPTNVGKQDHTHTHVEGGNSALITDVQTTAQFVLTRTNRRTEKTRCPGCCSQRGRSSVNTDSTVWRRLMELIHLLPYETLHHWCWSKCY